MFTFVLLGASLVILLPGMKENFNYIAGTQVFGTFNVVDVGSTKSNIICANGEV